MDLSFLNAGGVDASASRMVTLRARSTLLPGREMILPWSSTPLLLRLSKKSRHPGDKLRVAGNRTSDHTPAGMRG